MRGIARVEQCLRRRGGLSSGDVEDFALECACLTYRNIVDGTLALDADPAKRESQIIGYMRTMGSRLAGNRKRFKDVFPAPCTRGRHGGARGAHVHRGARP
jgi:hypothetical protein